jgi:hypothetical protein
MEAFFDQVDSTRERTTVIKSIALANHCLIALGKRRDVKPASPLTLVIYSLCSF